MFLRNFCARLGIALLVSAAVVDGNGGRDDPILAGYDLVAYHDLEAWEDGIPGTTQFQHRHEGYLYYFADQNNLDKFRADPQPYLPMYGGFCAWGIAWEYKDDGWPWARNHMGPPCGPSDGWALFTDPESGQRRLFCSIWRSYQDEFNQKQQEGIRLANKRWIDFYGSLDAGPKNNGCYAWNWRECFATSIYDPSNPIYVHPNPSPSPSVAPSQTQTLFDADEAKSLIAGWSDPMSLLNGTLTFQYTLEDIASIRPLLVVDLMYEVDDEFDNLDNQYLGFGVAEQVMEGALVVCRPENQGVAITRSELAIGGSNCKTYLGAGMGIAELGTDPVQPVVRLSERNESHYHVRFAANLFACWSNPVWPARVLFSRGLVSGNGDPMPHKNNLMHRQAVDGVEFLSVLDPIDAPTLDTQGPPEPLNLDPLQAAMVVQVEGTTGSLVILESRVTVEYGLFHYGLEKEEVVHVNLSNVPFDPQDADQQNTYIGFGFSTETMTGLIVTCAPSVDWDVNKEGNTVLLGNVTATCHQWRGLGSNLYPLRLLVDAGGWFLQSLKGNGTHVNYTLAGRVRDVLDIAGERLASDTNLRAICAIGGTAPDTGTPLMHRSQDRTPMVLDWLAAAVDPESTAGRYGNGENWNFDSFERASPSNEDESAASLKALAVASATISFGIMWTFGAY